MGFRDKSTGISESARYNPGEKISPRKLKNRIKALQSEIEKLYTAAGEALYIAHTKNTESAEALSIFERIDAINKDIYAMNADIDRANGNVRCKSCNSPVAAGLLFCPHCGMKMPEPPSPAHETCPGCGAVRAAGDRFCANCGFCFDASVKPAAAPELPAEFTPGEEPTIAAPIVFDNDEDDDTQVIVDEIVTASDPAAFNADDDDDDDLKTEPVDPNEEWFVDAPFIATKPAANTENS